MDAEVMLENLLEAGILTESGDELRVTEEGAAAIQRNRTVMEDAASKTVIEALGELIGTAGTDLDATDLTPGDRRFASYAAALQDFGFADERERDDGIALLLVLDYVYRGNPPESGAPEGFLPVHGDMLSPLFRFSPRGIVYVWRDDCPPCRVMREELTRAFASSDGDLARFAVFGPDWSEFLQERFDVLGGPTTLFMQGRRVDLRLLGVHTADEIERESTTLREL